MLNFLIQQLEDVSCRIYVKWFWLQKYTHLLKISKYQNSKKTSVKVINMAIKKLKEVIEERLRFENLI